MQLGFLLLTDHSEALNGKLYAMGGGWNMLRFAELPVEHALRDRLRHRRRLGRDEPAPHARLEIQDPDGERLGDELSFEIEVGRPPGLGAPARTSASCSRSRRTATFAKPGPHAVVIRAGEREIGRSRFYVARGAAGDAPASSLTIARSRIARSAARYAKLRRR